MYALRRTVAVRFSLTIFVALLLIALWAYHGTRRILREALDRNLAASAQLEAAVLASRLPIAIHPGSADVDRFIQRVNRFVAIRDENGDIIESNTGLAAELPLARDAFEHALTGDTVWATQEWARGTLRSYYAPTPAGSRSQHVVTQVAASLRPLQASTREVLFLMLGTVLLGTVATAIGAGWLATTTVRPVLEITEQAQSIQPGAGQRITAHADVEEFAGLIEVLNTVFGRLERAFEAQRRMIADAGHDLRTPLTAMRGELEIALRGDRRSEEYRAILGSVLEEVDHLTSISESLTLLARLEAGELTLSRMESDVGTIMERAVQKARTRGAGRTVDFERSPQETSAFVDPAMLNVAVDQLLDNSIEHTPPGTRVRAAVTASLRTVTISIDDSGPGMPPERLSRLFEHFYRSDVARARTGAAGLGLTITAAIVHAHGGRIHADQSPLGGLRITLDIPRFVPTE
jgi:signal transduction histidine kinase